VKRTLLVAATVAVAGVLLPTTARGAVNADGSASFHVRLGDQSLNYTLPPSSVVTFKWKPGVAAANAWVTTTKATSLGGRLAKKLVKSSIGFTAADSTSEIPIDTSAVRQPMTGFGAALTDAAATAISTNPSQDQIIQALFGNGGARLNLVRLPMGSTDFEAPHSGRPTFSTYDDVPAGSTDPSLAHFSIQRDEVNGAVAVLQAAKRVRPKLAILGAPWSAPAWMKRNGNLVCNGSTSRLKSGVFDAYASYFVKFVQAYKEKTLPIFMVSMQNEPHNCNPNFPTMLMEPAEQAKLASVLRTKLNAAGFTGVGIMAWDHNWSDSSNGAPAAYPADAVAAPGGSSIDAIGYHHYAGEPTGQAVGVGTRRAVHFTEGTGLANLDDASNNLVWEISHDLIGAIRNGARSSFYWNAALTDHGPTQGDCRCRALIEINGSTQGFVRSDDFYFWAHFSKFVDPGAVRLETPDVGGTIENVAFKNPDGSIVVVVLNTESLWRGYANHIVQWVGDTDSSKTSWLVGPDGRRRWIDSRATYDCLKSQQFVGPDTLNETMLDTLTDVRDVWAVCGGDRLGPESMLQRGAYARSANGLFRLDVRRSDGVVTLSGPNGSVWSTGVAGDSLKVESNGNVAQLLNGQTVWTANTAGRGAKWLVVMNDGRLTLFNADGQAVWSSN
jgi:O-glycosyl hydrolase